MICVGVVAFVADTAHGKPETKPKFSTDKGLVFNGLRFFDGSP
jgi:hypothetical protein